MQDGVVMDEAEFKTQRSNRDESNLDVEFNDRKFSAASVDVLIGKNSLTLGRQLFATPGAPDAGSSCHFRLSSLILRVTEVIATNAFFINSGHRFLTNITIQNTNYMEDRLKIKK